MTNLSGLITLTQISDGKDGELFRIVSDVNEIVKTETGDMLNEQNRGVSFSPSSLSFQLVNGRGESVGGNEIPAIYVLLSEEGLWQKINFVDREEPLKTLYFDEEKQKYFCRILQIFNYKFVGETEEPSEELIEARQKQVVGIRFEFLKDENVYTATFPMQQGYSTHLATLSLGAEGIVGAYKYNKLTFNTDGLTIYGDGLRIKKGDQEVFYADDDGNLTLIGRIEALEGKVGNITLQNGELKGDNDSFLISSSGIVTNNITIGDQAVIDNTIQLGNSYLRNPKPGNLDRTVLKTGEIVIQDNNLIKVGNIEIFGGDNNGNLAYIKSRGISGAEWKVTGNGMATFNEIYAENLHLGNSILETDTIQSVGSTMIFKDSAAINKILALSDSIIRVTLDQEIPFKRGEWILVNNNYFQILESNTSKGNYWFEIKDATGAVQVGQIVTKVGQAGSDFVLSIRGSKFSSQDLNDYAWDNSLALSGFEIIDGNPIFTKHLVLGQLDGLEDMSGFGLYADNVFLKGSLTTKVPVGETSQPTFAGINTISATKDTKFEDESSYIVFWAGARNIDDIQNSSFFVTDRGNLYAQNARIENSLFTGTINASTITTAEIVGNGVGSALTIYDTAEGISFKKIADGNETFKITAKGLESDEEEIINVEDRVVVSADRFVFRGTGQANMEQDTETTRLSSSQAVEIRAPKARVTGNFSLEQNGLKMEYQQKGNGFDLFITPIEAKEVRVIK